jgi:hypothetical protein
MCQTASSPVRHLRVQWVATATVAVLATASANPLPVQAQAPAAGTAATKPATALEVNIYNQMGAVNICSLATNKVPFDKSLPASIEMIVSTLNFVHGGIVQGANNNSKLEVAQLANGTAFSVIPRVKQICYDKFTAEDKKKIDDLLAQIQRVLKGQPAAGK